MKKTVDEINKMIMEDAPMEEINDAIGYAIDHSVLRVRYKKQAGDKPSACFLFIILQSVY